MDGASRTVTEAISHRNAESEEVQGAVAVAAPDHHGDREAEHGRKGGPTKGDQHDVALTCGSLPRLVPQLSVRISIVMHRLAPFVTLTRAPGSRIRATATPGQAPVMERIRQQLPYPHCRVIVLDDDVNTYQHVVECLVRYIPGMGPDRAWDLARRIDTEGQAEVWSGPKEQAELYHQQLGSEGLTMAPLEMI